MADTDIDPHDNAPVEEPSFERLSRFAEDFRSKRKSTGWRLGAGSNDTAWDEISSELEHRRNLLWIMSTLKDSQVDIDAVDLFVEKAQSPLSQRANDFDGRSVRLTIAASVLVLALVTYNMVWGLRAFEAEIRDISAAGSAGILVFLAYTIRGLTLAGIVLGLAFYFASRSRSYTHESITIYNRRHAIRFGRLYLYLKLGGFSGKRLMDAKQSLTISEFVDAFGGQRETSTAFKDIRSEEQLATNWFTSLTNMGSRLFVPNATDSKKRGVPRTDAG